MCSVPLQLPQSSPRSDTVGHLVSLTIDDRILGMSSYLKMDRAGSREQSSIEAVFTVSSEASKGSSASSSYSFRARRRRKCCESS